MVLGAGMIGLGVIAFLKKAGAGLIVSTEINEHRAAVAKKMGADYVFNPLEVPDLKERVFELTGSNDVDDSNKGIYVLPSESRASPDDEAAEWVRVKWEDFRSVRFQKEGGP